MSGLSAAGGGGATFRAPSGHTLLPHPFTVGMLATIEGEALRAYKRERMRTFRDNSDLLGEHRDAALLAEMERLADVMVEDLPNKTAVFTRTEEVEEDGKKVQKVRREARKITFVSWWLLKSYEGKLTACWLSCRKGEPALTKEEFEAHFDKDAKALDQLSELVADLNSPKLGKDGGP